MRRACPESIRARPRDCRGPRRTGRLRTGSGNIRSGSGGWRTPADRARRLPPADRAGYPDSRECPSRTAGTTGTARTGPSRDSGRTRWISPNRTIRWNRSTAPSPRSRWTGSSTRSRWTGSTPRSGSTESTGTSPGSGCRACAKFRQSPSTRCTTAEQGRAARHRPTLRRRVAFRARAAHRLVVRADGRWIGDLERRRRPYAAQAGEGAIRAHPRGVCAGRCPWSGPCGPDPAAGVP